jgi:hypothetical protein
LLYKKEEKRRVIPISWMRMSAAAAVIILIAATWITQRDRLVNNDQTVAISIPVVKPADGKKDALQPASSQPAAAEQLASVDNEQAENNIKAQTGTNIKLVDGSKGTLVRNNTKAFKVVAPVEEQKTQKLLPPTPEMMAAIIRKNPVAGSGTPTDISDKTSTMSQNVIAAARNNDEATSSIVKTAVYKEFDDDEESNTLYFGAAEINRNKLKSIFKKASSLFERKEKNGDDDHTINIASFQIKSK